MQVPIALAGTSDPDPAQVRVDLYKLLVGADPGEQRESFTFWAKQAIDDLDAYLAQPSPGAAR